MTENYGRVDPAQREAEEWLGRVIARTLVVVAIFAALGLAIPSAEVFAWFSVGVALLIPIARVFWLAVRWARLRDARYVWAAVALLILIAVGPVIAAVSR